MVDGFDGEMASSPEKGSAEMLFRFCISALSVNKAAIKFLWLPVLNFWSCVFPRIDVQELV